jgi:hypothetical protein
VQSKPSSIAMNAVNTITVICQSAYGPSSPLKQRGKSMQSALEPQGSLANERNEGVMRKSFNCCNANATIATMNQEVLSTGNLRQIGKIHASDLPQRERQDQQKTCKKEFAKSNTHKNCCDTCATRHTSNAEKSTDTILSNNKPAQAAMTTTKTKITIFMM